jgi:ribosome-associated toxin RatA of RatAB toxin-antitoxin module
MNAMYTVDELAMQASVEACFRAAAEVERWPRILPHYRWVHFQRKDGFGTGRVEMAVRRAFGPLPYPVWWVSEMRLDESRPAVLYHHVEGVTRGMDVEWSFQEQGDGSTRVKIIHDWPEGPAWPLPRSVRTAIARLVIGPIFIHHVAGRTLRGIRADVEVGASRSEV